MNYLYAEHIAKSYADKLLFSDLAISINKGEKVALVAKNGTGKTTLLNILAKRDVPDSGQVTLKNDIQVGYLSQDPSFQEGVTVFDAIFRAETPVLQAVRQYEKALYQQQQSASEEAQNKLQKAIEEMDHRQAWDFEAQVKQILGKLSITDYNQKVDQLSGGQKKRLALAQLLLEEPDFFILDEPTNHLDLDMIEWLEQYLARQNLTLLLVTHDRYFLNRITHRIIELDEGQLFSYQGNFEYFLEKKEEREQREAQEHQKAKQLLKKELSWVKQQPKARGTKDKARIESTKKLQDKVESTSSPQELKMDVEMKRMGSKILELHNISKSFDQRTIIEQLSYKFSKKERMGIIGKNGTGKSTFLNLITNLEEPDTGKIVWGETVQIGYYRQEGIKLNEDKRVIDVITDIAEHIVLGPNLKMTAKQFLNHFLFPPKTQYTYVSKLSGGEKRRLYLMTVLMKRPNFLILDEPTNDLDLMTLQVLEDFLENFDGCLVVVTHDRYFMDKLVDHLFVLEGDGKIEDFPGTYTQYREYQRQQKQEKSDKPSSSKEKASKKDKTEKTQKKLSYKEKREYEKLEKEIEELERKKEELSEQISTSATDHESIANLSEELGEIMQQIDEKTNRWMELAEKTEK